MMTSKIDRTNRINLCALFVASATLVYAHTSVAQENPTPPAPEDPPPAPKTDPAPPIAEDTATEVPAQPTPPPQPKPTGDGANENAVTFEPEPTYGAPLAPSPGEHANELPGQIDRGFALELHIGTHAASWAFVDDDFLGMSFMEGGLLLGYKVDRVTYGIGFEFSRVSFKSSYDGGPGFDTEDDSESFGSFLIVPGIRVAVARSQDQRVEAILHADFGIGTRFESDDDDASNTDDASYLIMGYAFGPGVRYWVHPQFSMGLVGGLRGNYIRISDDDYTNSLHLMSVFGLAQITGVF